MHKFVGLIAICFFAAFNTTFSQTDSVKIDCDDFEAQIMKAFVNKYRTYEQYETLVLSTLSNGNKKQLKTENLAEVLSTTDLIEYKFGVEAVEVLNDRFFLWTHGNEFNPIFELNEYESDFRGPFWLWQTSWEYLKHHTIDIKSYATIIYEISQEEFLDMTFSCNQKAFVLMLGKILGDQSKSTDRVDFYAKTEPVIADFFKSAGVDINTFENDFIDYLHSYEFTDSTIENQYFAYHFYTSDLVFMPLPQSKELQKKFSEYHRKLFTQDAFFIDTLKIVPRPKSRDSLSLLKDIMRAFPDSMMFAPGKSQFELNLEQVIEQEKKDDKWFLTIYAGVFKFRHASLHESVVRYSPIDFRSSAFRKWYALFVLQEMFNPDNIKPGVTQIENTYRIYPDYNEEIHNYFSLFLFNAQSLNTQIVKPYYDNKRVQTFNSSNYHLEIFDNTLFKNDTTGFRIQLKLDPAGDFVRDVSIIEPLMSQAKEKLLLDALSKYKFNPFLVKRPDSTGYGWIQITCKKRLEREGDSVWDEWDDVNMSVMNEVPDEMIADETEEDEIFHFTETEAVFIHGKEGLEKFIEKRMPKDLKTSERGIVYVRFTVNKDGDLVDFRVIKGINEELNGIALDITKEMPNWIPAEMDNKPVRSYFTLPIVFK
ncbi:MAG: hypothetical protein ACI8ZM_004414 [Crocinitomix sp.]|jgi:hypothetical protein